MQAKCPSCEKTLKIQAAWIGKTGKCKHCGHKFTIMVNDSAEIKQLSDLCIAKEYHYLADASENNIDVTQYTAEELRKTMVYVLFGFQNEHLVGNHIKVDYDPSAVPTNEQIDWGQMESGCGFPKVKGAKVSMWEVFRAMIKEIAAHQITIDTYLSNNMNYMNGWWVAASNKAKNHSEPI